MLLSPDRRGLSKQEPITSNLTSQLNKVSSGFQIFFELDLKCEAQNEFCFAVRIFTGNIWPF